MTEGGSLSVLQPGWEGEGELSGATGHGCRGEHGRRLDTGVRASAKASVWPLTFDDKNIRLGTDPLDFGALRQVVAVGVVASPALIHARVVAREVCDVDGTGRVQVVGGVDFDTVLPCTIPELIIGLIWLVSLKPPLDLRDGIANRLAVQLDAVLSQSLLRQW